MNCKPNDLAVIVSIPDPRCRPDIGRFVTVTSLTKSWDGVDCWYIKEPFHTPGLGKCLAVADRDLKPIRGAEKFIYEMKESVKEMI